MIVHRLRRWGVSVWRLIGGSLLVGVWRRTRAAVPSWIPAASDPAASGVPESTLDDGARFQAAVRLYGLADADLRRMHRDHAVRCYVRVGAALFALSFGAISAYLTFGGFVALLAVLMALLFVAASARSSLRAWQIRAGRLGSFGAWARTPAVWFPPFWERP